jgi:hypothetical protein
MKLFRGILVALTLVTLCLLVSAEKSEEEFVGDAIQWAKVETVTGSTRSTFYGECERKKKSLVGTCGKDAECVPKDSGCKGKCACDLAGLNECKCRGLYGGGMRKKAIELFYSDDADLGKVLGGFLAGVTKGNNDLYKQFRTERCQSEVMNITDDIKLDLRVINFQFRKALNTAEDRPSEEVAFQNSFEGKALSKLERRYRRLVQVILNLLQKGLVVASKCGVEEESVKLLGVTSAALVMKESYLSKKDTTKTQAKVKKSDIVKVTRSILEYIQESAEELHKDLTKELFFKVLGNVARHLFAGERDTAAYSKTLLEKFGFHKIHLLSSLEKDVEALVSSKDSIPAFDSSPDTFNVTKKKYKSIPTWLEAALFTKTAVRGTVKVGKKFVKGTVKVGKKIVKGVVKYWRKGVNWVKGVLGLKSKFQPGTPEHPFTNRAFYPSKDIECLDSECAPTNSIEGKEGKQSLKTNDESSSRRKSFRRASSESFLEMTSVRDCKGCEGLCNGVPAEEVLAGIDTNCKSEYDFDAGSNPNLVECLVFVAENKKEVTLTRGKDHLWLKGEAETVKYDMECGDGRRRRLLVARGGGHSS